VTLLQYELPEEKDRMCALGASKVVAAVSIQLILWQVIEVCRVGDASSLAPSAA